MGNISIGGRISLLQRFASLDLRYGPYSSIADAFQNMGPSGDEVITAGLPFGVTEDDGSVSVYIWTKGEDATQNDCKKLDKEHIVLFNGFIDISVSVKQQSYNDIATKSNIVFLSDRKQFAYRDGLNFYINWKNRYVWSSENLIPYDDVIYIDITTSKSYYFNGTTLVSLTYDIVVTSINNQSPDANGNVTLNKEDIGLENVDNTADEDKIVKGASEDGSGNVITATYETKTDATTKQTTLQGAINALQTSVAALTGLDSTNFGGFSIQSTEADAISNIATLYTADGYTNELLWYMAGTSLSSVKAYRYNGSGTPTAISSDSYDCLDFSGLITDVSTLSQNLAALGPELAQRPRYENEQECDFAIVDEQGYKIAKFKDGNFFTKNFNSTGVNAKLDTIEEGAEANDVKSNDKEGSADLYITDENGNILAMFFDGHFRTKKFNSKNISANGVPDIVVLDNNEICDYFAISSNGTHVADSNFGCSRYIDCHNVDSIELTMPVTATSSGKGIAFYDSSKTFISFVECSVGASDGVETNTIDVPSNAYYFRTTYWNMANCATYGKFQCTITYPSGTLGAGKYRPYQNGQINFSVEVDQSVEDWQSTASDTERAKDIKKTTGVLMLPTSYTKNGKKTPMIMYCHGLSHGVYYGTWGSTANFLTQKEHFIARGYAVFDCNGAKDTEKQASGANTFLSSPQNVCAYYKTYKYIVENYNVDDKIYVVGGSMGGLVSTQFCLTHGNVVKAFAILAGYTSLQSWWGSSSGANTYPPYFGVTGNDKTYETNIEKLRGYAPELRIFSINGTTYYNGMECPVHAWLGSEDSATNMQPQLDNFIAALRNSGKPAFFRKPTGLGHEIVSGAVLTIDNEICDFFDTYK